MKTDLKKGNGMNLIMVGSSLPDELKNELVLRCREVSLRLSEVEQPLQLLQLSQDEMVLIISKRKEIEKHKEVISSVSDLVRREELLKAAISFKSKIPENINYSYKKTLKESTNLSWSQFNVLIDSLLLYGFIKTPLDDKDMVIFTISDEDRAINGIEKIKNLMDTAFMELEVISSSSNFDKETLRKVNLLKKKMKFDHAN